MEQSTLTFFCELDTVALQALFADGVVIKRLKALGAALSIGIRDLSDERAAVVRRLNEAGIPLTAWLLLPEDEGYWFNVDNAPQAVNRYLDFCTWCEAHNLVWEGVGLDIEPDIRELGRALAGEASVLLKVLRRCLNKRHFAQARAAYVALVEQIRVDGYRVDSYHFPVIVDERGIGSTLLQQLTGIVDIPADREVLMLYSSFLRPLGAGALWSYAPEAQSVGVGSTGGGVTVGDVDQIPLLSWEELSRDLRLAQLWSDDIHVFSLEGAVKKGFLARLEDFDWSQTLPLPLDEARQVARMRASLRALLWLSIHPGVVVVGLLALLWLITRLWRRNGKN